MGSRADTTRQGSREFTCAVNGFSATEEKVLRSIFSLSSIRARRYVPWEGQPAPDICIVNADHPEALQTWRMLRERFPGAAVPAVRVGAVPTDSADLGGDTTTVFYKRPLLSSRLLKTLDGLVAEVYGFTPDVAIRDDARVDTVSDMTASEGRPSTSRGATGKRILVIDDSAAVRTMMGLRLVNQGYQADFAESGEQGLAMAQGTDYDLIFVDVMLPGVNGYDVCRRLKRDLGVASPVVMLTSKSSAIDKLRGSLAAADAYLTKPLALNELNATLTRFLHGPSGSEAAGGMDPSPVYAAPVPVCQAA